MSQDGKERLIHSGYLRSILCLWVALFPSNGTPLSRAAGVDVRIGRISKLEAVEVEKEAASFMQYLEEKAPGFRFRVVHLHSDAEAIQAGIQGRVDFLYVTPSVFVQLEVQSGATVIATAKRFHGPHAVLKYVGGVIICRSDNSGIQRLADLRGKRVIGLNPLALGGWISALRELDDEGIDPGKDFSEVRFGGSPEAVADAVVRGESDAGVLSISELPNLCNGGRFSMKQFRVLPPRSRYPLLQGVPVSASTRLYPGTAFVRMPHVSDEIAEKVASALFEMQESSQVARRMLVAGWTLPANYQTVHECLRQLRLPPYESFGQVTLLGAIGQHWQMVTLSLMILLGALMVAMIIALRLNLRLRGSQTSLHEELEQRRQAEKALSYQAELLSHTRDAVVAADSEYRVTFWNEAAESLYGIRKGEAIGSKIDEIVPWFSSSMPRAEIRTRLEDNGGWSGEISFRNPSGALVYADLSISRITDSNGLMVGSVGGIRDITERKRLEEQLLQSQKMQAIGLLAGGVAHDFNNLLTVINGYANLASESLDDKATVTESLDEVLKAGTRATELTRQLLAFGRKQALQLQVLNLNALVSDAERLLRRLIPENIELLLKLDPAGGNIKADPGQIQQVIMNLAVNARDALPDGGRLTIRTSRVEFGLERARDHPDLVPGRYILLTVEDNGVGMDEATQKRVFEPFFTTKETGKGTGLGLSTVYGIVKQSGGHIWVQSESGFGTKFTVCLPDIPSIPEPVAPVRGARPTAGKGKVLIVEDQAEVRELACRILTSCGYQVTHAANGADALQISESGQEAIDLLLTDVIMPGMNGPELASRLKSRHTLMKVLFMSGFSDRESARIASLGSEGEYLQKPFLPNVLAQRVSDILGPSRET